MLQAGDLGVGEVACEGPGEPAANLFCIGVDAGTMHPRERAAVAIKPLALKAHVLRQAKPLQGLGRLATVGLGALGRVNFNQPDFQSPVATLGGERVTVVNSNDRASAGLQRSYGQQPSATDIKQPR